MLSMLLVMAAFLLAMIAAFVNAPPEHIWRNRLLCFALACFFLAELLARATQAKLFS